MCDIMKPILQVALDLLNAKRALTIADDAVKGGVDWIEAGTPLIKSEGMQIIRDLKTHFPSHQIVADMKTMDTGAVETEMAAKAGADVVCLLGAADDATITDAVASGKKFGTKLMIDLLGISNLKKRVKELESMKVDYLCIHVGIDEQMKGKTPMECVSALVQETSIPIAVAGGLNSETVADVVKAGASIIIVGGAITKAHDVIKATKTIKKAMATQIKIVSDLYKKYTQDEVRIAFSKVSTPNISDAMHKKGAMKGIIPLRSGYHMVGQALTVRTMDGDWAKPIEAIDQAESGTVVVIDTNQGHTAVWGELATWSAQGKKIAGVVVDGAVRDVDDIKTMKLPVFSRRIAPNAGEPKGFGEIGIEILCGSQTVNTDDWIIGDDSGVVVVPKHLAQEIANRALDVKEHENRIREEIKQGGSLNSVIDVKKWEKVIG